MTVVVGIAVSAEAAIEITSEDDICPPMSDPCVVDRTYRVTDTHPVLDFGSRAVQIVGRGRLIVRTEAQLSTLRCGEFTATGRGTAIVLVPSSSGISTNLDVIVRRACSADPGLPCSDDGQCIGAGTCSIASGDATISAGIRGAGGLFTVDAAGSIRIDGKTRLSGSRASRGDAGILDLTADGPILLGGRLRARGERDGFSGEVYLDSLATVSIRGRIDLNGDEGGRVKVDASGDVDLDADVRVQSKGLGGYGGSFEAETNGRITVASATRILATSDAPDDGFAAGVGGDIYLFGAAGVEVAQDAFFDASGSKLGDEPAGGFVEIYSDGPILFAGTARANAPSQDGGGGYIAIEAAGDLTVSASAVLVSDGASLPFSSLPLDGELHLVAGGDLSFAGTFESPTPGRALGQLEMRAGRTLHMSGIVRMLARPEAVGQTAVLEGCFVTIAAGAVLETSGSDAYNQITARESLVVEAGASVLSVENSSGFSGNLFRYRNGTPAPVVLGLVEPVPQITSSSFLPACP